jgi:hypothetical protein
MPRGLVLSLRRPSSVLTVGRRLNLPCRWLFDGNFHRLLDFLAKLLVLFEQA